MVLLVFWQCLQSTSFYLVSSSLKPECVQTTDRAFFSIVQAAEVGPVVRALSPLHVVQYCRLEGVEDSQYTHSSMFCFF